MDVYPGICHYFGFNTNISLTTYGKDGNEFLDREKLEFGY